MVMIPTFMLRLSSSLARGRFASTSSGSSWTDATAATLIAAPWPGNSSEGNGASRSAVLVGLAGFAAAMALLPDQKRLAQCYYKEEADGSVDRMARWRGGTWNIPRGTNPSFHLKTVNPQLEKHLERASKGLTRSEEGRPLSVLVPLCGKTCDMPYLCEMGFDVVGVEGAQRAIFEFRDEHKVRVRGLKSPVVFSPTAEGWKEGVSFQPSENFTGRRHGLVFKKDVQGIGYYQDQPVVWKGKVSLGKTSSTSLHLIQGDMFDVSPDLVKAATSSKTGQFDLAYDRASLVALPPNVREQYAKVISDLVRPGGRILLVVVDYDQSLAPQDATGKVKSPPPFSVTESHVRQLYPEHSWIIERLDERVDEELSDHNPAFHNVPVREVVYLLTKRGAAGGANAKASGGSSGRGTASTVGIVALAGLGIATVAAVLHGKSK